MLASVAPALEAAPAPQKPAPAKGTSRPQPMLPDSLARRIEKAYFTLSRINGAARSSADTQDLSEDLPQVEENLETIRQNLAHFGSVEDVKQLQMYRVLLEDMQEQLSDWRTVLANGNQQLTATQARLDTLATELAPTTAQPAATTAFDQAVARLRTDQDRATALLARRRHAVTSLQTRVSVAYIQVLELQDVVREQMGRFSHANQQVELPPLWQPDRIVANEQMSALVRQSYAAQRSLVGYYFTEHWGYWVLMVVVAGGFFGWVSRSYRFLRRAAVEGNSTAAPAATLVLTDHRLHYLRPVPVAASLLVVFSLAPFLDLQPPATYTDLLQLLLLLTLTALGWRSWPRSLFWYWLAIVGAFFVLNLTYAQRAPGLGARWAMLLLNAGAVALGWRLWGYLRQHRVLAGFVKPVVWLFIGLNGLALLANATGRVSLAKMFTTTAIFGLTQVIALSAFVRIVTEAFYLQVQRSRQAGGLGAQLHFGKMESGLRRGLTAVVGVLWLMLFTTNLNLYNLCYRVIAGTLTATHKLGSTTFTLGSLLLFVSIIFLTIQLQKYVGYFFGETEDDFSAETDRKGTWMVAIRLSILAVGLFLATLASGLPVDKIAIVLGALGVGIGLGLQNIINNLVSGVILIFERPFQVGDYIEVKGQTGRVKDIGIRSSKLISQAGSEIILPNGDLLSNHVINWTLSNNHIRTELALNLGPEIDLDEARRLISEEILKNPNTLHKIAPEILLSNVATTGYDLKALFWINNIRQEQVLKSELLAGIHQRLTQAGIAMR
ncbi:MULTISPECIES: mechanosensitive ion channel domain-containing protein [unclassified Hymenobacter]|uniref:mechanosensitive ion channel domain-containing protein n=1 Tax=unclassified Hymenobacter TaxID=2615202 RepID=UPI001AAE08E9|nr:MULTISPECIES: mechanosensitive ion channel domain-containing protein [unclassified Hymenobacter]